MAVAGGPAGRRVINAVRAGHTFIHSGVALGDDHFAPEGGVGHVAYKRLDAVIAVTLGAFVGVLVGARVGIFVGAVVGTAILG